ncbi:hypothetical protein NIES267_55080 [Calothrix parasitica NIES-267]|uniref:Uncharacterized protein n=1 Tax=Calothrix parasitica NIES-267 TaxID=1973488 RepID=A0A1Z4LXP7_9CYAN|nr:hypothetical protein NIES267_55080 [Calothrix parasitica NIES-267]
MEVSDTVNNGTKTASKGGDKTTKEVKRQRHYGVLQPSSDADDMAKATYNGLVDNVPREWKSVKNYELFSLTPDGLFPWLKVSRNKAVRLFDGHVEMVSDGRCYKIMLSSH